VYNRLLSRIQCQWLISVLLLAVVTRALIPVGFMPAANFTYEICPDGFPAQLLHGVGKSAAHGDASVHDEHAAHHVHAAQSESQHSGHGSHEHAVRAEHCVFAAAAGAGPAPHTVLSLTAVETETAAHLYFSPAPPTLAGYRVQQPRGPPQLS
jgi:hypothetical protein